MDAETAAPSRTAKRERNNLTKEEKRPGIVRTAPATKDCMKLPQRSKADDPTQGQTPPNDSLALHPPLPSLMTDCVIVGHARESRCRFHLAAMVRRVRPHVEMVTRPTFFNAIPEQRRTGENIPKAFKADVEKRIDWAWDTIRGKAKLPGVDWILSH